MFFAGRLVVCDHQPNLRAVLRVSGFRVLGLRVSGLFSFAGGGGGD